MGERKTIQLYSANKFKISIDYLSRETFDTTLEANESKTGKIVESRRKNITSDYVIANVTANDVNLTEFDRAVLNAVIAEQAAGNEFTTPRRLFHLLGGGHVLTNDMRKAILDSIERLASVRITVEMEKARNELGYGADIGKSTLKGYLLPTESLKTTINGQPVDSIHILSKGMIFGIADMKDQIITCDQNLLESPIRKSERGIALNHYLLRRTLEIKGSHEQRKSKVTPLRNIITFDDLFKKCGFENASRRQKQQVKETVEKILDFFVEKNLIQSFKFETREKGKIHSIVIEF